MGSWADDYDSAYAMVCEELVRLRAADRHNQLLSYFLILDDDPFGGDDVKARDALKDRFWDRSEPWRSSPGVIVLTVVLANYALALRSAADSLTRIAV